MSHTHSLTLRLASSTKYLLFGRSLRLCHLEFDKEAISDCCRSLTGRYRFTKATPVGMNLFVIIHKMYINLSCIVLESLDFSGSINYTLKFSFHYLYQKEIGFYLKQSYPILFCIYCFAKYLLILMKVLYFQIPTDSFESIKIIVIFT